VVFAFSDGVLALVRTLCCSVCLWTALSSGCEVVIVFGSRLAVLGVGWGGSLCHLVVVHDCRLVVGW